jgi:hypothetical protein
MQQIELFPSVSGQIDTKGDVGVDLNSALWVVEVCNKDHVWEPFDNGAHAYTSRKDARNAARDVRYSCHVETRVVTYKGVIDSKFRRNRQIRGQRLDY